MSGRVRLVVLSIATAGAVVVLIAQLWVLQILEGPRLRELSERNRLRLRATLAPRGILYDRNGIPFVENRPTFTLSLIPRELEDREAVVSRLAVLLQIPVLEIVEPLDRADPESLWPVRVRRDLSVEEVARIEEHRLDLPGVLVEVEPQRTYQDGRFASHLLGYVREVTEEQLREADGRYRRGDLVGQRGLERLYDRYLKGVDGGEQIEVDAYGRRVRTVDRRDPVPGSHIVTTIDQRMQEVVERNMANRVGAAVLMDPRNGDILALVSSPSYPLDLFSGRMGRKEWTRLSQNPAHPLINRVTQSQYPPGSIFKLVVAAAALQEGYVPPFERFRCERAIRVGRWNYKNWKDEDQGEMDLPRAIVRSCNTVFYQVGLRVGIDTIARYARMFGFGQPTGSELGGERTGFVPTREWKAKTRGAPWYHGDTVIATIGQGAVLATPIQIARFMAAIANGGALWKPRLVQRVESPSGEVLKEEKPLAMARVDLSPLVWQYLRRSLWAAVNGDGTGTAARVPGLEVAGKTATAQTVPTRDGEREDRVKGNRYQDHAWFAAYAPADDPQVVLVVLVEHGGGGGMTAAPLAKKILEGIFFEKVARVGAARSRG